MEILLKVKTHIVFLKFCVIIGTFLGFLDSKKYIFQNLSI